MVILRIGGQQIVYRHHEIGQGTAIVADAFGRWHRFFDEEAEAIRRNEDLLSNRHVATLDLGPYAEQLRDEADAVLAGLSFDADGMPSLTSCHVHVGPVS